MNRFFTKILDNKKYKDLEFYINSLAYEELGNKKFINFLYQRISKKELCDIKKNGDVSILLLYYAEFLFKKHNKPIKEYIKENLDRISDSLIKEYLIIAYKNNHYDLLMEIKSDGKCFIDSFLELYLLNNLGFIEIVNLKDFELKIKQDNSDEMDILLNWDIRPSVFNKNIGIKYYDNYLYLMKILDKKLFLDQDCYGDILSRLDSEFLFDEEFLSRRYAPFLERAELSFPILNPNAEEIISKYIKKMMDKLTTCPKDIQNKYIKRLKNQKNSKSALLKMIIKEYEEHFYNSWKLLECNPEFKDAFYKSLHRNIYGFLYYYEDILPTLERIENFDDFCECFIGKKSRSIVKACREKLFKDDYFDIELLLKLNFFKGIINDPNHILSLINNHDISEKDFMFQFAVMGKEPYIKAKRGFSHMYKELNHIFSEKDLLKFDFRFSDTDYIIDTNVMIKKIIEKNKGLLIKNKKRFKRYFSIDNIHNVCVRIVSELGLCEANLEQKELFDKINGKKIGEYTIEVPLSGKLLVRAGTDLNICVGSSDYDSRINNKDINIILLRNTKEEYTYCIELIRNEGILTFGQAKGYGNKNMDEEVKVNLTKFLTKAELLRKIWRRTKESIINNHDESGHVILPSDCYILSFGNETPYFGDGHHIEVLGDVNSGSVKFKAAVGDDSPPWWNDKRDSVFKIPDNFLLFIEGKHKFREENRLARSI